MQGRSLVPLLGGRRAADWRTSFLVEYWSENAMPWLVGMTYKAVRTERAKLIHWVNRDGVDELYDLAADPYELRNLHDEPARAPDPVQVSVTSQSPTAGRQTVVAGAKPSVGQALPTPDKIIKAVLDTAAEMRRA